MCLCTTKKNGPATLGGFYIMCCNNTISGINKLFLYTTLNLTNVYW